MTSSRVAIPSLILAFTTAALNGSPASSSQATVRIEPIQVDKSYEQSVEPGSLGFACADDAGQLESFFGSRTLPFDQGLLRARRGKRCHIFYEPTIRGFRVDVDDQPIRELFSDVETSNLLSRRSRRIGDSLDMLKTMLPLIPRPLEIHLGVVKAYDDELYQRASNFHFRGTIHKLSFRNGETDVVSPWVQDYLKSGTAGSQRVILVTRLLYEGSVENGILFRPLLDSLRQERFVRSKLSWEGGDLQFVRHPKYPEKTVLFFGNAGKNYWARYLSPEEYQYVLKLEFGADEAVRLADLAPHVDYFISFIPDENIALVSQPERGNMALALGAVRALRERFADDAPAPLRDLEQLLSLGETEFRKNVNAVKRALQRAKDAEWPEPMDTTLAARIRRYVDRHCPQVESDCMSVAGRRKMLVEDAELFRDWTTAGWEGKSQRVFVPYSLALVESQLPGFPNRHRDRIEAKAREVEALGFRVIRVPRVSGEADLGLPWAGISYVNNLLVDNLLFVPAYGLGAAEDQIFDDLQRSLPQRYRVVPVFSRHMILYNGGVHCIVGIVRTPEFPPAAQ